MEAAELDETDLQNMRQRMEMINDAYQNEEIDGSSEANIVLAGNQSLANAANLGPRSVRQSDDIYGLAIPSMVDILSPKTDRYNFLQLQQQKVNQFRK